MRLRYAGAFFSQPRESGFTSVGQVLSQKLKNPQSPKMRDNYTKKISLGKEHFSSWDTLVSQRPPHPPLSSNQWKKVSQNYKIPENEWNFQFFGAITVQNHRTSLNSLWPAFFSNFLNKRSLERYPRWQPRIPLLGARKPPKLYLLGLERRNLG